MESAAELNVAGFFFQWVRKITTTKVCLLDDLHGSEIDQGRVCFLLKLS